MDRARGIPTTRTGRVLPFARPGALLPADREAIASFAAGQGSARIQFVELDAGRCAAMLEVATRRLCIERRGEIVVARKVSGGVPFTAGSADDVLAAAEAWLLASSEAHPPVAEAS